MGLYANRPIAVAPYMGENAFIAFGLAALGITWQQRLGAVFVSGVLFLIITLLGSARLAGEVDLAEPEAQLRRRHRTVSRVHRPDRDRHRRERDRRAGEDRQPAQPAGAAGDRRVRRDDGADATARARRDPDRHRRHRRSPASSSASATRRARSSRCRSPATTASRRSRCSSTSPACCGCRFLPILLTLFLMSFLDTLGTLVGVGAAGGMLDANGNFPDIEKPMLVDADLVLLQRPRRHVDQRRVHRVGGRHPRRRADRPGGGHDRPALRAVALLHPARRAAAGAALRLRPGADRGRRADARRRSRSIDFDDLTELVPGLRHDRDDGLHLQHRQRADRGPGAPSADEAAGRTAARDRRRSIVLAALCVVYYVFGLPH